MKPAITIFIMLFAFHSVNAQDYPIDLNITSKNFKEVREVCDIDNGKLWGRNLWAPMLLIDVKTRFIVANQPDKEGLLKKEGDVFIGYFPKNKAIANSTTDYGGENWMMVLYPLPADDYLMKYLCVHELYHRLQNQLNLVFSYSNDHMDQLDARILIKLEWVALEKSMNEVNAEKRNESLTDALVFRNYRRELYPGSDTMENKMELHEGLADYTGHRIVSKTNEEYKSNALTAKKMYWENNSYVRSFGYYSGLLYGYILDQGNSDWKNDLKKSSDLGLMAKDINKINIPENLKKAYEKSRNKYDFEDISQFETAREKKLREMLIAYRIKFTKDTVLVLDVPRPNVVFNPGSLVPLDNLGTVYPTIKIIGDWGTLQVNDGGCLFDWKKAIVPATGIKKLENKILGAGWELELNQDWHLIRDGGNYQLKKSK